MEQIPQHLKKYIVEQNYEKYTPVDHACWRFILRQLKSFLSLHAHECYIEGLEKTGIEVEKIPRISDISKKIEKFGWRAFPVSGFIPPAAFMELQSLGVLPIASDMRTLDHLMYTPAPDIVHEAAGHAPILINPEFAQYLREYAQVAKKAIISSEDLELYEAIRILSDTKENPHSTPTEINEAQKKLDQTSKNMTHVSEAAELARMNWWTAEYGLIGDIDNPKMYGAGLLSSVGESRLCLSDKVKKIPLSVDCIKVSYDITEQQPQLFVAKEFSALPKVLAEMANQMAFKTGGVGGLQKALQAKTVNTVQYNSGIQISGVLSEIVFDSKKENPVYLKFSGPTQLSYQDKELPGHDKKYHLQGYGTVLGRLKQFPNLCPSELSDQQLQSCSFEFVSGINIKGSLQDITRKNGKAILLSFKDCTVTNGTQILFQPDWGTYDVSLGSKVTSVFGGPADRSQYGSTEDFVVKKIPTVEYSANEKLLHKQYASIRELREKKVSGSDLENKLRSLLATHAEQFANDWLFLIEAYELVLSQLSSSPLKSDILTRVENISKKYPDKKGIIEDGLALASQL